MLTSFEDINTKYNCRFERDRYEDEPITEQEIVEIFNSNEIPEKYLQLCEIDETGIYNNVCASYYHLVKKDYQTACNFRKTSAEKGCIIAMKDIIIYSDSMPGELFKISRDTLMEYCDEILASPKPYYKMYFFKANALIPFVTNEPEAKYVETLLEAGMENKDCLSCFALTNFAISNKNVKKALELSNLSLEFANYDATIKLDKFLKIHKQQLNAINDLQSKMEC